MATKQPINLTLAKGRKHYTKAEIAARIAQEPQVPYTDIEAPDYLTGKQVDEFYDIAYKLLDIGIMTELDEDCLANYLISKNLYLQYTKLLTQSIKKGKIDECAKYANTQDKFFRQCRTAASDLGLTITSRCKLVVPEPKEYAEL